MQSRLPIAMTLLLALATVAMAGDPFVGTWKSNLAKSKVNPGPGFIKSETFKVEAQDNGQKMVYEAVYTNGKVSHGEYAAKYDGKDCPVTGDPDCDAVSIKRINAHTLDFLWKKDGKIIVRNRALFSKDEKMWTDIGKTKNSSEPDINYVGVYDKQ